MALILVVDDTFMNRVLVRDILVPLGHDVIEAESGAECLDILNKTKPDCILMDIQMPVMDGYECIKIIKSNPEIKDIKIIAVTSFAMKGDKEHIMEIGADEYISKPIDTRNFVEVVARVLKS